MLRWRSQTRSSLAITFLFLVSPLWAAPDSSTEITENAGELKETLEAMPYTPQGEGPVVYTFEFSDCPYSQRFYRDWKGNLDNVQMRRFFYATSQKSANETAALAASRDPGDYQAYMEGRKTAPRFDDTRQTQQQINQNFEHYQSVMKPLIEVVTPILVKNGAIEGNIISPMLIWEKGDRLFAAGGYEHSHIESILTHVSIDEPSAGGATTAETSNVGSTTDKSSPSTPGGHDFDVKGFTTGMSKEAFVELAETMLHEQSGIDEVVMVLSSPQGEKLPQTAHTISVKFRNQDRNPIEAWTTRNPMEERVYHLTFSDSWNNEQIHSAPTFETFVEMLKDRYGEPVHSSERRLSAIQWTADYVFSNGEFRESCPHKIPSGADLSGRSHVTGSFEHLAHFKSCPAVLYVSFSYLKQPGTPVRSVGFTMFDPQLWKEDIDTFTPYWNAWMNDYLEEQGSNRDKPSF